MTDPTAPTIGRIVHYQLADHDVTHIMNQRDLTGRSPATRRRPARCARRSSSASSTAARP
ncbi:hypothetical protein [Leifsonia sp. NPDC077715]|uniref:hypothetical protein n=1 Tax=Leifsonia sp. NPDC077715 TaxID=3155539 RepID=UPI00344A1379